MMKELRPATGMFSGRAVRALLCLASGGCGASSVRSAPADALDVTTEIRVFQDAPLHDIRSIERRSDGHIFALTGAPPFVFEFLADGTPVDRPSIPRGRGPGDLSNPWQLLLNSTGDTVFIVDVANRKLLPVTDSLHQAAPLPWRSAPRGTILGSIRQRAYGDPLRVARLQGRLVFAEYAGGVTEQSDLANGVLQAASLGADDLETLLDFRTLASEAGKPVPPRKQPLAATPLWTVCRDGRVLVFDPYARALHAVAPEAQRRRGMAINGSPRRLERDDIVAHLRVQLRSETNGRMTDEDAARALTQILGPASRLYPEEAPDAVELRCDLSGRAWLQLFDGSGDGLGHGAIWHVADTSLKIISRARLPERFQPFVFDSTGAIGVLRDDDDVEYVARVSGPIFGQPAAFLRGEEQ